MRLRYKNNNICAVCPTLFLLPVDAILKDAQQAVDNLWDKE